jgi:RimJ/RimL family protein N-acetyltransferase
MFKESGLVKLWGGFYGGHSASERVFLKNGFQVEGRVKKKYVNREKVRVDWVLMGLLAEEFAAKLEYLGPLPPVRSTAE